MNDYKLAKEEVKETFYEFTTMTDEKTAAQLTVAFASLFQTYMLEDQVDRIIDTLFELKNSIDTSSKKIADRIADEDEELATVVDNGLKDFSDNLEGILFRTKS